MKKIFTFLLFAGSMTTAMAQQNRNSQYRDHNTDNRVQSPGYSSNNQQDNRTAYDRTNNQVGNTYQQGGGYRSDDNRYNSQINNYGSNGSSNHAFNHEQEAYRDNDHFSHDRRYEQRRELDRYGRGRTNVWIGFRFGRRGCF